MSVRNRLAPLLHALFFLAAATQTAIVPLLPRLSHAYGLSPSAGALLLGAPGLATLAVSIPAGVVADRLGARRVTIAASALIALAALAQAAPSYAGLMAGRLAFGVGFGVVWTTGVAWLSAAGTEEHAPHIGAAATSAAVGMVAGPAIGGVLADQLGLGAPFVFVSGLSALLTGALVVQRAAARRPQPAAPHGSLRELLRVAPTRPGVVAGALVLAVAGAVGGVTQLLVPLQLHQAGFSAADTGLAFSAAAGVYIVVSAAIVRLGPRATTVRVAALAGMAIGLAVVPAAFGHGAALLVLVLMAATAPRAVISTISYPLATHSVGQDALGDGVIIGLLNGTWAIGLVLAPLLAGAVDQLAGPGPAYLVAALPGLAASTWLLERGRRTPAEVVVLT